MLTRFFLPLIVGLGAAATALPALARPEIASGDRLLPMDSQGCLSRADSLIQSLGVTSDSGEIDRTGYFEDGSFRILCYSSGDQSMAIVFASHEESLDVATAFVRMALEQLDPSEAAPGDGSEVIEPAPEAPQEF